VQDPNPIEHFWLMQMLGNLEAKRNFIFSVPITCSKHFPAPLTVPLADTLLSMQILCFVMQCICVSISLFCTRAQGNLAVQLLHGCERKDKKYVFKFCPPNFFDSFVPLLRYRARIFQGDPKFWKFQALHLYKDEKNLKMY